MTPDASTRPTAPHSGAADGRGEPYIALTPDEVVSLCVEQTASGQRRNIEKLARILRAWYHFEYLEQLVELKALYTGRRTSLARAHPDDGVDPQPLVPEAFASSLRKLATAANYTPIPEQDLNESLNEESEFRIGIFVDLEDFAEVVFFRRGEREREAEIKTWFGLARRTVSFVSYDRVLVYVRFREAEHFADRDILFKPGSAMLKLFQNVPKADLEMLFPNTEVRMKLRDKLFIGIPAAASGIIMLTTKLDATILLLFALLSFWLGFRTEPVYLDQTALAVLASGGAALGAYLWKQFTNFKNRKIRFMKALTENLYFKNLDNNLGVLTYLVDNAEEADFKEALLGYAWLASNEGGTAADVRDGVNEWLVMPGFEFDVEDSLSKLVALGLIQATATGYVGLQPGAAFAAVDARWDALFDPSETDPEAHAVQAADHRARANGDDTAGAS